MKSLVKTWRIFVAHPIILKCHLWGKEYIWDILSVSKLSAWRPLGTCVVYLTRCPVRNLKLSPVTEQDAMEAVKNRKTRKKTHKTTNP